MNLETIPSSHVDVHRENIERRKYTDNLDDNIILKEIEHGGRSPEDVNQGRANHGTENSTSGKKTAAIVAAIGFLLINLMFFCSVWTLKAENSDPTIRSRELVFKMKAKTPERREHARKLLSCKNTAEGTKDPGLAVSCILGSFIVESSDLAQMKLACDNNKEVELIREWNDANESIYKICPGLSFEWTGSFYMGVYSSEGEDRTIYFTPGTNDEWTLSGNGIQSDEGGRCDVNDDCQSGLSCDGVDGSSGTGTCILTTTTTTTSTTTSTTTTATTDTAISDCLDEWLPNVVYELDDEVSFRDDIFVCIDDLECGNTAPQDDFVGTVWMWDRVCN